MKWCLQKRNWTKLTEVCVDSAGLQGVHLHALSITVPTLLPTDKRFPDSAKLDLIFTPVMPEKDLTDGECSGYDNTTECSHTLPTTKQLYHK